MVFGVIVAGGVGSRMGADIPKQFLMLGEQPIIIRTLQTFLDCSALDEVYVGIHPEWMTYMENLVGEYIPEADWGHIHLTAGGSERNDTIMNVIGQIESDFGNAETHYIITQDGVRPFVTVDLIERHVEAVQKYDAVDTVIPAVDTIILSEDGEVIDSIPERRFLYQSQTPQSFRMDLLKDRFGKLSEEEKAILTDACKICTVSGVPVHLVRGSVSNLKITTTADLQIAEAVIDRMA